MQGHAHSPASSNHAVIIRGEEVATCQDCGEEIHRPSSIETRANRNPWTGISEPLILASALMRRADLLDADIDILGRLYRAADPRQRCLLAAAVYDAYSDTTWTTFRERYVD